MVNLFATSKATMWIVLGWIVVVVLEFSADSLISIVEIGFDELTGAANFFIILMMIMAVIAFPILKITQGITEPTEDSRSSSIIQALLVFFVGMVITIVGYFMIPGMIGTVDDTLTKGILYTGIIASWILIVVVAPTVKIIKVSS